MRTLAYGLFLVLLLAGSIVLLRSVEAPDSDPVRSPRFPGAVKPDVSVIDHERLDEASADELYALGVEYLRIWRVREAAVVFEHAVAADSTRSDCWRRLIECYANPLIDDEDALDYAVERAFVTAGPDTALLAGLHDLYVSQDYAGAVARLSDIVRDDSRNADARYHLALAYFRLGQLEETTRQLTPLMRADASVGPVAELYVRRAVAAGELDRAADGAREIARMYNEEPYPYVLLAQVEMARGNPAGAVEFCNNALLLDARCIPAIMTRALLYAHTRDFEAARVSYEKLMLFDELVLQSIGREGIGFVDFLSGEFDEGLDAMDEAIRLAMLSGATARGLTISLRLVEYLCQLGQADAAENVVERWITGFGDVPVRLARARIQILRGDFQSAATVLEALETDKDWVLWSRLLSLDPVELNALAEIGQQRQKQALAILASDDVTAAVGPGAAGRRGFLTGYAAFESGDAERATAAFVGVEQRLYGPEFPYHGDPVLFVQSVFFLAESNIARGDQSTARSNYLRFLDYWGDAAWDLDAVTRARQKIEALGDVPAPPQG
jgi:tetratricopeptide (TPR) repeat protein